MGRRNGGLGVGRAGDEAGAAVVGEIEKAPLDEDENAALKFDDVHEMDEEPYEPRGQAGDVEAENVGDGGGASDDGHVAFVDVVKRRRSGLARETGEDDFGGVAAALNGDLGDAGEKLPFPRCWLLVPA